MFNSREVRHKHVLAMKNSDRQAFGYGIPGDEKAGWLPENVEGLTKREYFAGLAMQAILSNEELRIACMADAKILGVIRNEAVARYSVMEADELLKQLEQ